MTNEIYIEDVREKADLSEEMKNLLEKTVEAALSYEKVEMPCFVSISIVEEDEIKEINNEHRGIDKVTDVLSFPVVNLIDGTFTEDAGDF